MAAYLSPVCNEPMVDANGDPLSGGKVYTYLAGTSTPAVTYTDSTGVTPQANPVILNSRGVPASPIWLGAGVAMKIVVKTSADVTLAPTYDNILGVNDPSGVTAQDQWVAFSGTATYIGATSFSVAGDQTTTFQINRRLKTLNSGGTVYSSISNSAFGAGVTTVTVVNDSGTLDSGLSSVSYALLSATNPSIPASVALLNSARVDLASAATVNLTAGAANSPNIQITGTTPITAFTIAAGRVYFVRFAGALTLTNNASIVTQIGQNITTQAGDTCVLRSTADNVVEVLCYAEVNKLTVGTQVSASGTSVDFTGIPSWAKRVVLMLNGISTNGTANLLIQIGDSGGVETTGYLGSSASMADGTATAAAAFTTGFGLRAASAANVFQGAITLELMDATTNTWVARGMVGNSNSANVVITAGSKSLSAVLDRVRLTTSGADTFDAGTANIQYE